MDATLNDIRLLKLAEMYERAYEAFVVEMAQRVVEDPELRGVLAGLSAPTDRHEERIVDELRRLNAAVSPEERRAIERAAILDVVDVERSARDFYLAHLDDVHDPGVARLFADLAREEGGHVRVAQRALDLAERSSGRVAGVERFRTGSARTR